MKIETTTKRLTGVRAKDEKTASSRAAASVAGPLAVSDDVRLTDTSGRLRQLEGDLAGVDVADSGKIEAVRQAIEQGSFVVDEEAVAEGLIQESIENITHQPEK